MDFEYCEKCGKRVPSDKIDRGEGGYVGIDYYCENCLPPSAKGRVARPGSQNRRSSAQSERRGDRGRSSRPSRETRATSRVAPARSSRYDDDYDSPRGSRGSRGSSRAGGAGRSSRSESRGGSGSRSGSRSGRGGARQSGRNGYRDDYRDDYKDDNKKKMIIIGSSIAGVILIIILIAAFSGKDKKPVQPSVAPTATAAKLPEYAAKLRQAEVYFEDARKQYNIGKAKEASYDQSVGIEKAIKILQKGIDLIQPIQDKYDVMDKEVPKEIAEFLEKAYKILQQYNKSKPLRDL